MLKKISVILLSLLLVGLVSCGSSYTPEELASYGEIYKSTTNTEEDGQYPVINISNVDIKDNNIIISIAAPTLEQIKYAYNNFLYVNPLDKDGDSIKIDKLQLNEVGGDIAAEISVEGIENIEDVKYIEVGPYKTNDGNKLIFEIK